MNKQIKVGDYIEGYEIWGVNNFRSIHKTRIIVKSIDKQGNISRYYGVADDGYGGARGTTLSSEIGAIRLIQDEEPFTRRWWEEERTISYSMEKTWNPGDIVRKCDGSVYQIVGTGINADNCGQVIIYKDFNDPANFYSEPRESFESVNTENDKQLWKFELVNQDLAKGGIYGCKSTYNVE